MGETTRRLYFYRALRRDKGGNIIPFDPAEIVKCAAGLPDSLDGRSMRISANMRVTMHVDTISPPRLRFGKTRLSDLPHEETREFKLQDLAVDPEGGTSDVIHVAFYDHGIVGQVYHHPGPTMNQLANFLLTRCREHLAVHFDFLPLLKPNALHDILRMEKVRSVTFTIDGGAADLLNNAKASKPLLLAARDVADIGKPITIQLSISRIQDDDAVKQVVTDIANNPNLAGAIRQVKVRGTNYEKGAEGKKPKARPSAVDLMSNDLIFEESILTMGNSRNLDHAAAYDALDRIYKAQRETLEQAAHVE